MPIQLKCNMCVYTQKATLNVRLKTLIYAKFDKGNKKGTHRPSSGFLYYKLHKGTENLNVLEYKFMEQVFPQVLITHHPISPISSEGKITSFHEK